MEQSQAKQLITTLFTSQFDNEKYQTFLVELLGSLDDDSGYNYRSGNVITEKYRNRIASYKRIAKYNTTDDKKIDLLIVNLKEECNLERHRSSLRNFIMEYLNETATRNAAIVAFVAHDKKRWRLSLVCLENELQITAKGNLKTSDKATPAKRYSFLLGQDEPSHTAQSQFLPLLTDNQYPPSLEQLEKIFAVEKLSDTFFNEYVQLLNKTKLAILDAAKQDSHYHIDEEIIKSKTSYSKYYLTTTGGKTIDVGNFAKKLLGQIVFLYFLQKKGWLGVAKDKSWGTGNKAFMRNIFSKYAPQASNYFNQFLEPLFYGALASERADDYFDLLDCKIPFLNGGLFEAYSGYDRVNHGLKLPNNLFSNDEKIKATKNSIEMSGTGILDVFDRYNFTVCEDEPLEKEVAIDPEMLGKIFENTIEDNERKGKGAFYTPRPIVHYMVKQSLIEYLASHLDYINDIQKPDLFHDNTTIALNSAIPATSVVIPAQAGIHEETNPLVTREDLQLVVNQAEFYLEHETRTYDKVQTSGKETEAYSHKIPKTIIPAAPRIDKLLADITILDPAVGSGAFPVGLLTEIVKIRQLLQVYIYPPKSELSSSVTPPPNLVIPAQAGIHRQPLTAYQLKYHAIANSIYGVDIDSGAIDVARLRLWLSLVVDEDDNNRQIQPLPNLDYKLVCGNSLTRINQHDMFIDEKINRLTELEQEFIEESRIKHKQQLKIEIDQLLTDIMQDGFDFRYVFGKYRDGDGFDIVIGNPPYVMEDENKAAFNGLHADPCYQGKTDLWHIFTGQGLSFLKESGILSYIAKNQWLESKSASKMRKAIYKHGNLLAITDFGANMVFDSAGQQTMFFFIQKCLVNNEHKIYYKKYINILPKLQVMNLLNIDSDENLKIVTKVIPKEYDENANLTFSAGEKEALLSKIESRKNFVFDEKKEIIQGIIGGPDDAFIVKEDDYNNFTPQEQQYLKRFHTNTGRYYTPEAKQYIFYISAKNFSDKNINDFPNIKSQLATYKVQLDNRRETLSGRKPWHCLWWERDESFFINGDKLVWAKRTEGAKFTFTTESFYGTANLFFIKSSRTNLGYITALLNSKLMYFYMHERLKHTGDLLQIDKNQFLKIPLFVPEDTSLFSILVNKIISIKQAAPKANTSVLEAEIDQLVYQLYELTPDEISLIEGSTK